MSSNHCISHRLHLAGKDALKDVIYFKKIYVIFLNQFPHLPKQSRECIISGLNHDGGWTTEKLKNQIINKAIPIFETTHLDCIALFAFDNATSHAAFADDALVASNVNWNDGGKQPKMRDTVFNGAVQQMTYPNGEQKGMKTILQERGLYKEGLKKVCSEC